MELYRNLADIKKPSADSYVTVGNFDGVHLGHQMLFSEVVTNAYNNKGTSVVVTFDPHPLQVLRPEIGIKLISTYEQKVEKLVRKHGSYQLEELHEDDEDDDSMDDD